MVERDDLDVADAALGGRHADLLDEPHHAAHAEALSDAQYATDM